MKVCENNISMVRGDSESFAVRCFGADEAVRPFVTGDEVCFTVKKSYLDKVPTLKKSITEFQDGVVVVSLLPEDTNGLSVARYKYDVQLTTASGAVKTIIPSSVFELTEDISHE